MSGINEKAYHVLLITKRGGHIWKIKRKIKMYIRGEHLIYTILKCKDCGIVGELYKKKIYVPKKYNITEVRRCHKVPYDIYKKHIHRTKKL